MIKNLFLKLLSVMKMNNFHPEDRLLRLIKGEKKEREGSDRLKRVLSILKMKPVVSINQILPVIISALLIYTAYIWIRPGTSEEILIPSPRVIDSRVINSGVASLKSADKKLKPSSFYSSMVKKRNLFKQLAANPVILPEVKVDMRKLVKDLKLIGIVLDEGTQAIIENRKTRSVLYLNEGGAVGELKVSRISESSVTLSYGTETIDLFL